MKLTKNSEFHEFRRNSEIHDAPREGSAHRTFPAHNGNAYHTLCEAQLVEMADYLHNKQPTTTSAALTLLRHAFPDNSVDLHLKACAAYAEKVQSGL